MPKELSKRVGCKVICCSYFEAGRSWAKRSLLEVNEHLNNKPDAKRAEHITLQLLLNDYQL